MSTVKISELPEITHLNTDTTQSLAMGVDLVTGVTGKMTIKTLAEGLYSNDVLNVGENLIVFPNVIAQFSGSSELYLQLNLQNFNGDGSGDMVITADNGTNSNNFVDLGINGSTFSDPAYSAMESLDGYLFVNGPTAESAKGNLTIGTISANAVVKFSPGGTTRENIVAFIDKTGFSLNGASVLTFTDGSIQSKAASPANYSQAAFAVANSASSNTVISQGVNATQNTNITSVNTYAASGYVLANTNATNITYVNTYAGSAYNKANNALANTSGTFAGNLNVTGNIIANGIATTNLVSFVSSTTPATNALIEVIGSTSGLQQTPSQDGYMLHVTGKDDIPTRIIFDAFGANSYPTIAGRKGRGVAGTPTAVANGDVLLRISGNGWGTTGFAPLGSGRIDFVAAENYTDATRGSQIRFYNVANGTNTINQIASFNANSVEFSGTVVPSKGFIYLPKSYVGAQTAITIDFANDTILRAQTAAGLTVTLSNFVYGKMVELWITNTSGGGQVFTHGCSATNSTVNSTTYNIPATSSILARYMSFDGDAANTFVSIVHS